MRPEIISMSGVNPHPIVGMANVTQTAPVNGDALGYSVALDFDGNTLAAVGANGVYIFTRVGAVWTQLVKVTPPTGATATMCVSISDDGLTMCVSGTNAVYVYQNVAGTWGLGATLTPSVTGGNFGETRALSMTGDGNRIAVGAKGQTVSGAATAGALFVFDRVSGNTWTETARVGRTTPAASQQLFETVKIAKASKNYIVATTAVASTVAAVVMFWNGSVWAEQAALTTIGTQHQDCCISRDGATVFIGDNNADSFGKVAHFSRNGTNWTKIASVGPLTNGGFTVGTYLACGPNGDFLATSNVTSYLYNVIRNGSAWLVKPPNNFGYPLIPNGISSFTNFRDISISGDGLVMAVGNPFQTSSQGRVDIYAGSYSG